MNKYLDLVHDILEGTQNGSLRWKQVDNEKNAQYIREPSNVIRQFETPFSFNGTPTTLVCVESRFYIDDYLFPHEDRRCELIVLAGKEVIEHLAPPFLPWFWLNNFADIIAAANNQGAVPNLA
jgi:hypothetical protein